MPNISATYGWPRAVKSSEGALWFATDSGVVTVDLAGRIADASLPPVLIEEVLVNGQPFSIPLSNAPAKIPGFGLPAHFPSAVRSLDIHFTALDLSAPEKIRFRHRLDGSDSDWVVDSDLNRREVHYPLLAYGPYTFHVQAGYEGQAWFENEASFQFLIPTPFWRTQWAVALYVAAGFRFLRARWPA